MILRACLLFLLFSPTAIPVLRGAAPEWLTATAVARPISAGETDDAVVLLNEQETDVTRDGRFVVRSRYAVRILSAEGRKHAAAYVPYEASSEKIRSFRAWLIAPSGKARTFPKSRTIDAAVDGSALELYSESRAVMLSAREEAEPGAVFGFEAFMEERSIFTQRVWHFQHRLPVECARFTVNLPAGWEVSALTINRDSVLPVVSGSSHTWELRNLAAPVREPGGPAYSSLTPRLAVDLHPPAAGVHGVPFARFDSWGSVVRYFLPKYDAASVPDAAIRQRAEALAAAGTNAWERAVALCRFAQRVNYISISLDTNAAGGYIPRPAARVFACNYGDCKDKTTLLRALLQAQGIESFPVLVYSGDPTFVRPEWASPFQFDHCILAIRVDDSAPQSAVVDHRSLGRLLFFDPTNTLTPPGLLAEENLGGLALILAPDEEELVRLPAISAANNRLERKVRARLQANGTISGTVEEQSFGYGSVAERDYLGTRTPSDYREFTESWLGNTLPAVRALRVEPADDFDRAQFRLNIDFAAPYYGRHMRDVLLVFKPVLLTRRTTLALKKEKRTQPVVLDAYAFEETTEIELPDGFRVDETIEPVELTGDFGIYTARAFEESGKLRFVRKLELRNAMVPVEDYDSVRTFFEKILQAEQAPVVLEKL